MSGATTPRTKMTLDSLLADLRSIVGPDHADAPKHEGYFAVDGLEPMAVVEPGTYEEVAATLRFANERGLGVIPRGSGLHRATGNIPRRHDIVLKLFRLHEIIEHEPADLTVTCQAGMTVEMLNRRLQKSGQMTAFGPYSRAPESLGGTVAADRCELRLAYGGPRDFTVGMRIVTADGRIIKAGGKVVKNVAGYDLTKLFVGSLGTLGVIVEVTFKLVPLPQQREWVRLEFDSADEACQFARTIYGNGLSIWNLGVTKFPQADALVLTIDLAGTIPAVGRSQREIYQLVQEKRVRPFIRKQGPKGEHDSPFWAMRNDPFVCEASVLPSLVPRLIEALDRDVPGGLVRASPIEGWSKLFWPNTRRSDAALVSTLRSVVTELNGSLVITHCDPELKRQIDVFGDVPSKTLDLMRRIKHQFDPNGILSPGRFVGKL